MGRPTTRIGAAEQVLRDLGFDQLRVRDHNTIARIELPISEFSKLLTSSIKQEITTRLKALGYKYITIDIEGFRSGSMNE